MKLDLEAKSGSDTTVFIDMLPPPVFVPVQNIQWVKHHSKSRGNVGKQN